LDERETMLALIETEVRATSEWTGRAVLNPRVLAAMRTVPRHGFAPTSQARYAYANVPLPIGHGQTISQPFIVALMTDLLDLPPDARVLEIGTGSGYQAAVLAELTPHAHSIEIIPAMAQHAAQVLADHGYAGRVALRVGDGALGWPEHAPFDGIIVTAAAPDVPPALVTQLAPGGWMVIPVGPTCGAQDLRVLHRDEDGTLHSRSVMQVAFVPLTTRPGG
jgi:protein-L-isoaspartate(D-aspartate) O-methyltransferase